MMQLKHIGNEFDDMKGAVLGEFQEKELLRDLIVDPMARPAACWTAEHFRCYAQSLRLDGTHQIAKHGVQWGTGKRQRYFAELTCYSGRDFFLDPDVGVATSEARPQHIKPIEALGLLQDQNVIAVYQHGARGQTIAQRAQIVVQALQGCLPSIECLAYLEQKAGLLFLARQSVRLRDTHACLDQLHRGGSLERYLPN